MSIKAYNEELYQITKEMKNIKKHVKKLKSRKKFLEKSITDFLDSKGQPGMKYRNITLFVDNKVKRTYKSNKDKDIAAKKLLEHYNIENPEKVLKELLESRRGTYSSFDGFGYGCLRY